jgi:hypothetical protein
MIVVLFIYLLLFVLYAIKNTVLNIKTSICWISLYVEGFLYVHDVLILNLRVDS